MGTETKRTGEHGTMQASDVQPCRPGAVELADAVVALFAAQVKLEVAKQRVPNYLPTCSPADIVAEEQEVWNRAADRFQLAILALEDDSNAA